MKVLRTAMQTKTAPSPKIEGKQGRQVVDTEYRRQRGRKGPEYNGGFIPDT